MRCTVFSVLVFYLLQTTFADPIIDTGYIRILQPATTGSASYTHFFKSSFESLPLFSCSLVGFEMVAKQYEFLDLKFALSTSLHKSNFNLTIENTTWSQLYFSCAASTGDPLQLFFLTIDVLQTLSETEYRSDVEFLQSNLNFAPTTEMLIIYPNLCSFKYYFYTNSTAFFLQPSVNRQKATVSPVYYEATPVSFSYNDPFFNNSLSFSIANTAMDIKWLQVTLIVHTIWTNTVNRFTGYSFIETTEPGPVNIFNASDTVVNYMNLSSGAELFVLQGLYRLNLSVTANITISVNITIINTRQALLTGSNFYGIGEDVYLYKSFWDKGTEVKTLVAWQTILIVLGVLVVVAGIAVGVYCYIKKRREKYLDERSIKVPPRSESNVDDINHSGFGNRLELPQMHSQPHGVRRARRKSFMSSFPTNVGKSSSTLF